MHAMGDTAVAYGAVLGATGVVLGAFGAHALASRLGERRDTWETAVRYQLVHAAALLALGAWRPAGGDAWAVRALAAGVVLFSGSLYALALRRVRWLGPVTPLGGAILVVGWLLVLRAALGG